MKCLVLAGGSSERLWPLSRKEYPKQFMELREGRSMFQETILRNIPYCDEFIILTNKKYENVARGQMQVFQSVEYRFVLEEVFLKTAPSAILTSFQFDENEELLVVPSDSIIDGDYNASIAQLKEVVKDEKFAVITCKPKNLGNGYNYVRCGKKILFGVKPMKGCLWDTGIWGAKASVLWDAFDKQLVEKCNKLNFRNGVIVKEGAEDFIPVSLVKAVAPKNAQAIAATFDWTRITDISSFYRFYDKAIKNDKNTICNNSKGVEIVNMAEDQLIIANGIKNIVIVNTRDAIYVTTGAKEADIKSITNKYYPSKKKYFDLQPKKYESWGIAELVGSVGDCKIRQITVYPRESLKYKLKKNTVVNAFITQGRAHVENKRGERDYSENQNIFFNEQTEYTLSNAGKDDLIFIITEKTEKCGKSKSNRTEYLVKMKPVYKDNLWGGTKIRDVFGKDVGDMDVIAESWELSAHAAGQSKVAFGDNAGKTLTEYIDYIGKDRLGWKTQNYDKFPLMIKFIDAKQNLSIQVHPADEYAMLNEGEYGKNEMWHILDADEDACIYVGFNKDVTPEELRRRIADNTLMQVVNKIPVKKNETYFLKAGTVHAIGAGCLICEIQQSSNVTYRLYDYGRKDKTGNTRELHIDKAIDVLDMKAYEPKMYENYDAIIRSDYVKTLIGQCKYFTVNKYYIDGECPIPPTEASFQAFVILSGKGTISDGDSVSKTVAGDTWFCANKVRVTIKGQCQVLVANI